MFIDIAPKYLLVHTGYEHRIGDYHISKIKQIAEDIGANFELVAVKDSDNLTVYEEIDIGRWLNDIKTSVAIFKVDGNNYIQPLTEIYIDSNLYCRSFAIFQQKYDMENQILYIDMDSESG